MVPVKRQATGGFSLDDKLSAVGKVSGVHGDGDSAAVSRAAGDSSSRVQDGVPELEAGDTPLARIRRVGGGRKPAGQAINVRHVLPDTSK